MKLKKYLQKILILSGLLLLQVPINATEMSTKQHIQIEVAVREAAIAGAMARLEQLGRGDSIRKQTRRLSEQTYHKISLIYKEASISPSEHLIWENRHRDAIQSWLNAHPEAAQYYNELNDKIKRLSDLIDELQE